MKRLRAKPWFLLVPMPIIALTLLPTRAWPDAQQVVGRGRTASLGRHEPNLEVGPWQVSHGGGKSWIGSKKGL